MEQSNSSLLQEIFALESAEDWKNTSEHYESLYSSVHTNEVAIHFAFFAGIFSGNGMRSAFPAKNPCLYMKGRMQRPETEFQNRNYSPIWI